MSLQTRQQVARAIKAVENKKGEDVAILEMDQASGAFTDYFVICSGTNPRQIQAICDEVERQLAQAGLHPSSIEGYNQAEWVVLDYVDFIVHIFSEQKRKHFNLERLWKSARRFGPADLKKPAAKTAVAKKAKKSATSGKPRKPLRSKSPATRAKNKRRG
jgi:ribosome-associated protein